MCLFVLAASASAAFGQAEPVYATDISRPTPSAVPNGSPDENRSIFRSHDNREREVKTQDKAQIKKLKFGGDQTEEHGRFKGSMIEEEADLASFRNALNAAKAKSPEPQASPNQSPDAREKPAPSPTATATASPRPSSSP